VDIEADGPPEALCSFEQALLDEAPPLARIDQIEVTVRNSDGFSSFEIIPSESIDGAFQPISADVSICQECHWELFDQDNRRYRYPFINCTNCGPRFTIIKDIPYDRPLTTMAPFAMCRPCSVEYKNPLDRRFHAQPVACPDCGPHVWLESTNRMSEFSSQPGRSRSDSLRGEEAIQATRALLRQGNIVAVKGLGGFHLACDATNPVAVAELRRRKLRIDKPFALMMPNTETVKVHCHLTDDEKALLELRSRPIVLLKRRSNSQLTTELAPGQNLLGVMLPYTPLHYLLLEPAPDFPEALVMTSGNLSEEPIATDNEEARQGLSNLADAFLFHNRAIRTRCDDSVIRSNPVYDDLQAADFNTQKKSTSKSEPPFYTLRRSRGFAPFPVPMPWTVPPLLAGGAELKNTFCLTSGQQAFLSHHIGDMENFETLQAFEDGVIHFQRLFRVEPQAFAYDLHPNYLATRYIQKRAQEESLPAIGVQHHHAHVAACMAEHGFTGDRPVIGVSFDGTGYGEDGAIWGGEILIADYAGFERAYHLSYVPMPGGDKAIKEPWRMALAWLDAAGIEWDESLPAIKYPTNRSNPTQELTKVVRHQIKSGVNSPPTSSIGRLFDAVSSLAGIRHTANYEGQAAIEMEAIVDPNERGVYPLLLTGNQIDAAPLIREVVNDLHAGLNKTIIAARFHNSLAQMVMDVCWQLRLSHGLSEVILSGGVWQNMILLIQCVDLLRKQGFDVFLHQEVPVNDGGIAIGQAAVAAWKLEN
jgi:hydrogenase maturation protein HypF